MRELHNTVLFYTLADLKDKPNNKTPSAKAIIKSLDKYKLEYYSRDGSPGSTNPKVLAAYSQEIGKMFTFLGMNHLTKRYIDTWVADKPLPGKVAIFHPYTFPQAAQAYMDQRTVVINIGTSASGKKVYDLYDDEYKRAGINKKFKRPKGREPVSVCNYVIAYSEWAKESYVAAGVPEENVYVCNPGLDLDVKYKKKPQLGFTFLAVSDFDILKGYQYLVQAWNELDLKDAQLIIVGKQKEKNPLFEKYKNHPTIVLKGHQDTKLFYENCNVFVHPSLTEGFEKVTLEAMAHNMPVIITKNCGLANAIQDKKQGFVIDIQDVEALKKSIQYMYDHRDEVERMGMESKKVANQYTSEAYSNRLKVIWKEIFKKEKILGEMNFMDLIFSMGPFGNPGGLIKIK